MNTYDHRPVSPVFCPFAIISGERKVVGFIRTPCDLTDEQRTSDYHARRLAAKGL